MILPDDFDTCASGTLKTLSEQDVRIAELEAENQSLRVKLITAEAAFQFTPEQIESLKEVIKDMGKILEQEKLDEAA